MQRSPPNFRSSAKVRYISAAFAASAGWVAAAAAAAEVRRDR